MARLMAGPLRGVGGGGVKGQAIKEKKLFFGPFFQRSTFLTAIKLEGGVLGLNGRPGHKRREWTARPQEKGRPGHKRRTFFAAFLKPIFFKHP